MKAALKFYWPLLALMIPQVLFAAYLMVLDQPQCTHLFGWSVSLLALGLFCFIMPFTVAVGSGYLAYISYLALRSGRFPPEGVPGFKARKVVYGVKAKVLSGLGLALPVLAVVIIWLGFAAYLAITQGQGFEHLQDVLAQECGQPEPLQPGLK